jgi:hypothetical protein
MFYLYLWSSNYYAFSSSTTFLWQLIKLQMLLRIKSTNVITRKVNTGYYSNQNTWSPVLTLNYEINDRVRGLSPPVLSPNSPIAKILVCPDFPHYKYPVILPNSATAIRHSFSDTKVVKPIQIPPLVPPTTTFWKNITPVFVCRDWYRYHHPFIIPLKMILITWLKVHNTEQDFLMLRGHTTTISITADKYRRNVLSVLYMQISFN